MMCHCRIALCSVRWLKRKSNDSRTRRESCAASSGSMRKPKICRDAYDDTPAYVFIYGRQIRRKKRYRQPKWNNRKADLSSEYRAYILSDKWRSFRHEIIVARGKKCERCGKAGRVELHHLHYRNFENEKPEDVRLLCHPCHKIEDYNRKHGG